MKRFMITMSENDIELFESGREALNMTKSSYVRLLIAEHEKRVPAYIKYKDIIDKFSELDKDVRSLILSDKLSDTDKLILYEKADDLKKELRAIMALS